MANYNLAMAYLANEPGTCATAKLQGVTRRARRKGWDDAVDVAANRWTRGAMIEIGACPINGGRDMVLRYIDRHMKWMQTREGTPPIPTEYEATDDDKAAHDWELY